MKMAFPKSKRAEFAKQAAQIVEAAHRDAFMAAMQRLPEHSKQAVELLERFAEVYGEAPLRGSMIEPGRKLWRNYYEWTGEHMILVDGGWEPGEGKAGYEQMAKDESVALSSLILDEVNSPNV
jgi:hypothetical protein